MDNKSSSSGPQLGIRLRSLATNNGGSNSSESIFFNVKIMSQTSASSAILALESCRLTKAGSILLHSCQSLSFASVTLVGW